MCVLNFLNQPAVQNKASLTKCFNSQWNLKQSSDVITITEHFYNIAMKLDDNIAYIKNRTMKKEEHCNYFLWVTFSNPENPRESDKK